MLDERSFWHLASLTDRQVLDGIQALLGSSRRLTAELVAHLGEVEARRLHLDAACSSMFSYCVTRLGLSEDEACRRIDVARLARRFPAMFPLLASGQLSLSVAALLKPHLSAANASELLGAVASKSVQQAREAIAARFPSPDVPSVIRKLPERALPPPPIRDPTPASAAATPSLSMRTEPLPSSERSTPAPLPHPGAIENPPLLARPPSHAARIEPLSAGRFKVQFTADTKLKEKLELARDLMRHAHPDGDLAPIVARALDLLIDQQMNRRFGSKSRSKRDAGTEASTSSATAQGSSHIPRATRRAVLERDGLRCAWVDESGVRCDARAWLEHDHHRPRAKGGDAQPANIRLLCRAHNRRAAEREFGERAIQAAIARARRQRRRIRDSADTSGR